MKSGELRRKNKKKLPEMRLPRKELLSR